MVVVEASGRPLVASNADLTSTRAGGLRTDLAATFLEELADAAGLTIHVRLIEGENSQHVLSAIFKALGSALADATEGRLVVAEKNVVRTDRAPGPFQGAPYNQAMQVGDLVFVAGQLGLDLATGELAGRESASRPSRS